MKQLRRNGVYQIEDDTLSSTWESKCKRMKILTELVKENEQ
jgi:hypothetical protein